MTTLRYGLLSVLFLGLAAVSARGEDPAASLQGKWRVLSTVSDGKDEAVNEKAYFRFDGENLVMQRGDRELKSTFTLDATKQPAHIDLTIPGTKEATFGLLKIDGDDLTLCIPVGREAKRPTELAAPAESKRILFRMKREPK